LNALIQPTETESYVQIGPGVCHPAAAFVWPFKRKAKKLGKGQKRVLVLMSNTGGGHKASAEALEAGFKELYGDKCAFFALPWCTVSLARAVRRLLSVADCARSTMDAWDRA
jgi:predicted Ser/Thr protein kinase